jgi:hypothetical protein
MTLVCALAVNVALIDPAYLRHYSNLYLALLASSLLSVGAIWLALRRRKVESLSELYSPLLGFLMLGLAQFSDEANHAIIVALTTWFFILLLDAFKALRSDPQPPRSRGTVRSY